MNKFLLSLEESLSALASLRVLEGSLRSSVKQCSASLQRGGKLLICGNGGSAAEAMHLTGELVGRYKKERRPLAAITLGTDPALLTCIGNDYCYDEIFARQVRALARPTDILIVFSTSGSSGNVLRALEAAREMQIKSIAFLGRDGGPALGLADVALVVPHTDTARIQEGHQFLMHSLMDLLEDEVAEQDQGASIS
jgi:D-sedoheptulose 7-phosphate isomerase